MPFLQNAWYVAAWSDELGEEPVGRTILDKPVVLFRDSQGSPAALHNICPHRFVPLSAGKVRGDALECPYHGLRFGASGACVLNPHGPAIPNRAKVRSYPVVEKYDAVWIWTGDEELADGSMIPDFGLTPSHVPQARYRGRTHTHGNYQLVVDNLLDLSHAHWLHPQMRSGDEEKPQEAYEFRQEGDTLHNDGFARNVPPNGLFKMFCEDETVDFHLLMRWDAPSLLLFQVGVDKPGGPLQSYISFRGAHLITPETETTTHYFWQSSRNIAIDDATTEKLMAFSRLTFDEQDSPMVALQQKTIGTSDLMSLKPIILPSDAAAVHARRILQSKIQAERKAAEHATEAA